MIGTILSLITLIFIAIYGLLKLGDLVNRGDFLVLQATRVSHFGDKTPFGSNDGLNIAVGMVKWDDGQGAIEDPAYG